MTSRMTTHPDSSQHIPETRLSSTIKLPADARKQGTLLLNQQLWCWGQDVRYAGGNLLMAYGGQRIPTPDARKSTSQYVFEDAAGAGQVALWGFGVWYGMAGVGSVFLKRYEFRPRLNLSLYSAPEIWQTDRLPDLFTPTDPEEVQLARQLWVNALRWIGNYERWAHAQTSAAYRQGVVQAWPERRKGWIAVDQMATSWFHLADVVDDCGLHDSRNPYTYTH
jgi:hypothetical protein